MRLVRVSAIAACMAAMAVQTSTAQDGRQFKDAWFWGLKGGGLLYSSLSSDHGGAPLIGGEWLITRSNGGLYLSLDQAFLNTSGGFYDRDPDSAATFVRVVDLKNLRRFSAVAMAFPAQTTTRHPYVGIGLSLNQIGDAALVGNVSNSARFQVAQDSIQSRKSAFSPVMIAGVQWRLKPASVFTQVVGSPNQVGFFLTNASNSGLPFNLSFEAGVRYNVGTSIDRGR